MTEQREYRKRSLRHHVRMAVFERDGYQCRYCGVRYRNKRTRELLASHFVEATPWGGRAGWVGLLHVDHVIAECEGGTDDLDNLVTACSTCNLTKARRTWEPTELEPGV